MYGQLSRLVWIYFSRIHLARWNGLSCVVDVGEYGSLLCDACWDEAYCVLDSASNVSTEDSFWEIIVSWVIGMDVDDADLCLGCL